MTLAIDRRRVEMIFSRNRERPQLPEALPLIFCQQSTIAPRSEFQPHPCSPALGHAGTVSGASHRRSNSAGHSRQFPNEKRPSDPVNLLPMSPFRMPQSQPLELCRVFGDVYNQQMDIQHHLLEANLVYSFPPTCLPGQKRRVGSGFSQTTDQ